MSLINKSISLSSRFSIVIIAIVLVLILAVATLVQDLNRVREEVAVNTDNIFSIINKNSEITQQIYDISARTQFLEQIYLFDESVLIKENLFIDNKLQNIKLHSDDIEFSKKSDQFIRLFHKFLGNSLSLNNILQEREKIDKELGLVIDEMDFYVSRYYSNSNLNNNNIVDYLTASLEVSQIRENYLNVGRLSISIRSRITPQTESVLLTELEKELFLLKKYFSLFQNYDDEVAESINRSVKIIDEYILVLKKMKVNLSQRWGLIEVLLESQEELVNHIATTETEEKQRSLENVDRLLERITNLRSLILGVSIFIIFLGSSIFAMIIRHHINDPINNMISSIEDFEAGKLDQGIKLNRTDEWHTIEMAFNKMASRLDETYSQLISERRSFDYMAHHDPLTGLANRLFAYETIENMIESFGVDGKKFSLIYLDLDDFKQVNDSLGHSVGDELLLVIANKLHEIIGTSGTAVRLGGDEFMLLIPEDESHGRAGFYAEKVHEQIKKPIRLNGHAIVVGCSIGICHFPTHGNDAETLIRNADTAMYQAKAYDTKRICVYEEHMTQTAVDLIHKITGIRQAIEKDEFFLVYQPQFDLNTNTISGVEVLIRWQHPEAGVLSPDKFLPIAEQSGLSSEVDQWVFDTVVNQISLWKTKGINLDGIKVSVNFSGKKFADPKLLHRLDKSLSKAGCSASNIVIEITEQDLMTHIGRCVEIMEKLKEMGFLLAIDDFGTGYSSFGYLKNLPVDILKIDKIFINDVKANTKDLAIVRTMLSLASMLDLFVVAEGIETDIQKVLLQSHGCSYGQGYLLSMPLPLGEFEKLLINQSESDMQA